MKVEELSGFFRLYMFLESVSTSIVSFLLIVTKRDFVLELAQLTGIAAILRFPMPELEEEPVDSDEDSD